MQRQTVRYALIGAGMGAETHAAELPHVDGARLEAVYARSSQKAEKFRARYGARKAYADLDALLADPEIDAVIIVTPNGLHREFAVAAARAGKHVIVEKPLEITAARGRDIVDACIQEDVLYARDYWRGTREFEGGGCLMTQTTHLLDLAQFVVGPVTSTVARVKTAVHAIETEDLAVAMLNFESGALGVVSSSTAAFPAQRHLFTVIGTNGTMSINGEYDQVVFRGTKAGGTDIDTPTGFRFGDTADPRTFPTFRHRTQLLEITQCILARRPPVENASEYLQALYLTDAIYRSSAEGREVELAEFGRQDDLLRKVELSR